jgi:hypothetical protein
VDIVATALADLGGVARLAVATPIARFAPVGIVSTVAYALLLLALMMPLSSEAANAVALAITAVANTAANRRVTSGVRGREGMLTAIPAEAAASSRAGPRSRAAAADRRSGRRWRLVHQCTPRRRPRWRELVKQRDHQLGKTHYNSQTVGGQTVYNLTQPRES